MRMIVAATTVLALVLIVVVAALCVGSNLPTSQELGTLTFAKAIFPIDTDTDYWMSQSSGRAHRHLVMRSDKLLDIENRDHAQRLSEQIKARIAEEVDELLLFSSVVSVKSDDGTSFSGRIDSWRATGFEGKQFSETWSESSGRASSQKECLYLKAIYRRESAMGVVTLVLFGQDGATMLQLYEYPR